jgi:hypothetical protein
MRNGLRTALIGVLAFGFIFAPKVEAARERGQVSTDISLVHGIAGDDGFPVDILVQNNFRKLPLDDVTFGTAVNVNDIQPGFIRPGWVWVEVYASDSFENGRRDLPILSQLFWIGRGENKTVAAYVAADPLGDPIGPTLGVFRNQVTSLNGNARTQVRHLAVAPAVSVCANGAIDVTGGGFANGETATAVVPPGVYQVTVTAPGNCSAVLAGPLPLNLPANVNTLAFAIGVFPESFTVVTLPVAIGK